MEMTVDLPREGVLPPFGVARWLNSPPLTPKDLRGNIVLVDFWTYTCVNWLRTLGYVRAWFEKHRDPRAGAVTVYVLATCSPVARLPEREWRGARSGAPPFTRG